MFSKISMYHELRPMKITFIVKYQEISRNITERYQYNLSKSSETLCIGTCHTKVLGYAFEQYLDENVYDRDNHW